MYNMFFSFSECQTFAAFAAFYWFLVLQESNMRQQSVLAMQPANEVCRVQGDRYPGW